MTRIGQIALAAVGILAMAACAGRPTTALARTNEIQMEGSGIRPASDLTPEEREKAMEVLHRMLEAMTPAPGPEASDELLPEGAMSVSVYVYDQKTYDAAVAIVKACRPKSR